MIYKFTSKASGDVLMKQPVGDVVLNIIGKPSAAQGIIEVASMPAAIAALQAAMAATPPHSAPPAGDDGGDRDSSDHGSDLVSLRARIWPFLQLLEQSLAENTPVTWGT